MIWYHTLKEMNNTDKFTVKDVSELCHVTIRTLRYYDNIGLVSPQHDDKIGTRLYTLDDILLLQEVLTLKFIGFSLSEIKELIIDRNETLLSTRLNHQKKVLEEKIKYMKDIVNIINTAQNQHRNNEFHYSQIINIIKAIQAADMSLKQYTNHSNLEARINLHETYSTNQKIGWFEWCFDKMSLNENLKILDIGCGNGQLWLKNHNKIHSGLNIILGDLQEEMLNCAKRNLENFSHNFTYQIADVQDLPYSDDSFDIVIANHMMYHVQDINKGLSEIYRVLKKNGHVYMTTVGPNHLKEILNLIDEIDLGATRQQWSFLNTFNLTSGTTLLNKYFHSVKNFQYYDNLMVDKAEPIIQYIKSMEDKDNVIFKGKKLELLRTTLQKKILLDNGFFITKQIGMLTATK